MKKDSLNLLIAESINAVLKTEKKEKVVQDMLPEERGILFDVSYIVQGVKYTRKQTMQRINKEIKALKRKKVKFTCEYKKATPLPIESGTKNNKNENGI